MSKNGFSLVIIGATILLGACATMPKGATAIENFQKDRYLGKWYEIARFDFTFEKNLNNTTAEYSLRDDGKIAVKNRGYDYIQNKWKEALGKARFRGSTSVAELEVSFFGPFYAGYNVIALDREYQYALVAGSSLKYLWILSRERTIPDTIKEEYVNLAKSLGYKVEDLIWVLHDK